MNDTVRDKVGPTLKKVQAAAVTWFITNGAAALLLLFDAVAFEVSAAVSTVGGLAAVVAAYAVPEARDRLTGYLRASFPDVHLPPAPPADS